MASAQDRATAIEIMKAVFTSNGMSQEDADAMAPVFVDEAIKRQDEGEE